MENVKKMYREFPIEFLINSDDVMVNASHMAAVFDKRIVNFTRGENYESFKDSLRKSKKFLSYVQRSSLKSETSTMVFDRIIPDEELDKFMIHTKQGFNKTTYMYRTLALKFAAWLDPDFEVWVYEMIEDILFSEKANDIISYIQKYPKEKFKKGQAEVELKNARTLAGYYDLDREVTDLAVQIADWREEQKQIAVNSLVNEQGDLFLDSRERYFMKYNNLQKKIVKAEAEIKTITNKMMLIDERHDIKQLREIVSMHHKSMVSLKKNIAV